MNAHLLIDSIVSQITILIAQLATSGGIRAPVAHVANQVFLDLARELSAQGVSRKVSADMFGMALRAYVRKIRRLEEAQSERGKTLWQAVLDFVRKEALVDRGKVIERFRLDGEVEVTATLHDLCESGLVFSSGSGRSTVYRVTTDDEMGRLSELSGQDGIDEFTWAIVYRNGPISLPRLAAILRRSDADARGISSRLVEQGRIECDAEGRFTASDLCIPFGAGAGWEAAVFDHVQAVVQTICQRLGNVGFGPEATDTIGGSTYTFDVWPDHPFEGEVKGQLEEIRRRCGQLRQRVEAYNREHGLRPTFQQVTTYVGQCVIERERDNRNGDGTS